MSDSTRPSSSVVSDNIHLVLLPGMDGTGLLFAPFVAALADRWAITTVSYPGSGPSLTYAELQELAVSALPKTGRLVVLGESFSGPMALALAARFPERVVGVVLCCTFVRNPRPALRWLSGLSALPLPLPPWPIIAGLLLGRFATPALQKLLRAALARVEPAVLRARTQAILTVDVRAEARSLAMPVLYLRATADRLVPTAAAAEVARCCPGIRLRTFDAPHCPLQAVPEEAASAVADFVETIPS